MEISQMMSESEMRAKGISQFGTEHQIAPIKMAVLLECIAAMRRADGIRPTTGVDEWAQSLAELALARNHLERAIGHIEVGVEVPATLSDNNDIAGSVIKR